MTQMQLHYVELGEERRHNLAGEAEVMRHNKAVEDETYRHNTVTESQKWVELDLAYEQVKIGWAKVSIEYQEMLNRSRYYDAQISYLSAQTSVALKQLEVQDAQIKTYRAQALNFGANTRLAIMNWQIAKQKKDFLPVEQGLQIVSASTGAFRDVALGFGGIVSGFTSIGAAKSGKAVKNVIGFALK